MVTLVQWSACAVFQRVIKVEGELVSLLQHWSEVWLLFMPLICNSCVSKHIQESGLLSLRLRPDLAVVEEYRHLHRMLICSTILGIRLETEPERESHLQLNHCQYQFPRKFMVSWGSWECRSWARENVGKSCTMSSEVWGCNLEMEADKLENKSKLKCSQSRPIRRKLRGHRKPSWGG
jgi:hypothetical protein